MTVLNIILGIVAAVLLLFVIGETRPPMEPITKERRIGATIAFVAVVLLIIAANTIM